MADREKVIECLEKAKLVIETWVPMFEQYNTPAGIDETIELLKEQEPIKPKSKSRHGEYPQIVHRCGNCNEILYRYYKYCPSCGRPVKWE